jgi:hypothetical protein
MQRSVLLLLLLLTDHRVLRHARYLRAQHLSVYDAVQ